MIKAQSLHLVSRRLYLLFLTITVFFLGVSPMLHSQVSGSSSSPHQRKGRMLSKDYSIEIRKERKDREDDVE